MGLNVLCFTIVWIDRQTGEKRCLMADLDDPDEKNVKWVKIENLGRTFVTWLDSDICTRCKYWNRGGAFPFLKHYLTGCSNMYEFAPDGYCNLATIFAYRRNEDLRTSYAYESQYDEKLLKKATEEFTVALMWRNYLWYVPWLWEERELRFIAAGQMVEKVREESRSRRTRLLDEYVEKLIVLENNVVKAMGTDLQAFLVDKLDAKIVISCY